MNTITLVAILSAVILLVAGGILAFVFYYRQRTKRLKNNFGPEYDRTMDQAGNRRKAEADLERRQERVESLQKRKLSPEEQNHFLQNWKSIQTEFVDNPEWTVQESDHLVMEVMLARGYPMEDFDQRTNDISVDYPDLVSQYRSAHSIAAKNRDTDANTEELRQALLGYRMIFNELLDVDPEQELEPEMAMVE